MILFLQPGEFITLDIRGKFKDKFLEVNIPIHFENQLDDSQKDKIYVGEYSTFYPHLFPLKGKIINENIKIYGVTHKLIDYCCSGYKELLPGINIQIYVHEAIENETMTLIKSIHVELAVKKQDIQIRFHSIDYKILENTQDKLLHDYVLLYGKEIPYYRNIGDQ